MLIVGMPPRQGRDDGVRIGPLRSRRSRTTTVALPGSCAPTPATSPRSGWPLHPRCPRSHHRILTHAEHTSSVFLSESRRQDGRRILWVPGHATRCRRRQAVRPRAVKQHPCLTAHPRPDSKGVDYSKRREIGRFRLQWPRVGGNVFLTGYGNRRLGQSRLMTRRSWRMEFSGRTGGLYVCCEDGHVGLAAAPGSG